MSQVPSLQCWDDAQSPCVLFLWAAPKGWQWVPPCTTQLPEPHTGGGKGKVRNSTSIPASMAWNEHPWYSSIHKLMAWAPLAPEHTHDHAHPCSACTPWHPLEQCQEELGWFRTEGWHFGSSSPETMGRAGVITPWTVLSTS